MDTTAPPTTDTVRTARATGAAYLGLAVTGMLGFLVLRPTLVADDPAQTLAHLTDSPGLAHLAVALELGIVLTQALAAVGFYRLLRDVRPVAAYAVATFGIMNAAAIMASAAFLAATVTIAGDPSVIGAGDPVAAVGLLTQLSDASWAVGALFFGLWLIPMGWAAATTRRFPAWLGWLLLTGGIGYVASALVDTGLPDAPGWLVEGLSLPATAAEFSMIAYLLARGIRPRETAAPVAPDTTALERTSS